MVVSLEQLGRVGPALTIGLQDTFQCKCIQLTLPLLGQPGLGTFKCLVVKVTAVHSSRS